MQIRVNVGSSALTNTTQSNRMSQMKNNATPQKNPWSIKGVSSGAREAAKQIAGENGLTIRVEVRARQPDAARRCPPARPRARSCHLHHRANSRRDCR